MALGAVGLIVLLASLVVLAQAAGRPPSPGPAVDRAASPIAVASGEPGPTIDPDASVPPSATAEELYAALVRATATGRSFGESVELAIGTAGELVLPSGRLVASDAMLIDGLPFSVTTSPGRYPVRTLQAAFGGGDRRVAAAMVVLSEREPVSWELALVEGQDPADLGPEEFFGYGVDSGTGAFTSPEVVEQLRDASRYQAYSDAVTSTMFPTPDTFEDVAVVEVDPTSGANVVAISSGFGDGSYPTWVGRDASGTPVAFITDFGVLDAGA